MPSLSGNKSNLYRHGLSRHPLYRVWDSMIRRCSNRKHKQFKYYGKRGIRVCIEWWNPETFILWALGHGWKKGLHLDRIDNSGNYEPDNCRFVAPKTNLRNRRNTVFLTAFGETKATGDWLEDNRCQVGEQTLYWRVTQGWDHSLAITSPPHHGFRKSLR